jgi:DNA primase
MKSNGSWEEVKERIRDAADPVQIIGEHLTLHRQGNRFLALCPFHSEKTPSFTVNDKGFHCFGCGESGDVFSFLMKYENLSFPEALESLARRYQISLPESDQSEEARQQQQLRQHLQAINQAAAEMYHQYLLKASAAAPARRYLEERGVPQAFIEAYQLGYAPAIEKEGWGFLVARLAGQYPPALVEQAGLIVAKKNEGWYDRFRDRIMFPIMDSSGKTVAFGGRIIGEGQPKYLNSPESPIFTKSRLLFGLWQHREAIRQHKQALVVEGNFDLLLLAVHGLSNVVAPLGTALTKEHLRSLRSYCQEIVLLFDGDTAGLRAARRSVVLFLSEQMTCRVALLPQGQDPDSFVRKQGVAALQNLLERALSLPDFVFQTLVQEHGLDLTGKHKIAHELKEIIQQATQPMQRELMAKHWAKDLGLEVKHFLGSTLPQPELVPPPPEQEQEQYLAPQSHTPAALDLPQKERQLLHFLLLYPEFYPRLFQGGLEEYARLCSPPTQKIIAAFQRVEVPQQLLTLLAGTWEGHYMTDMFLHGTDDPVDEAKGEQLCQDLLAWLHAAQQKHSGSELQRQLHKAQEAGNRDLVEDLAQRIFEMRKKK